MITQRVTADQCWSTAGLLSWSVNLDWSHLPLADLVWLIFQLSWAKSTADPF